MVTRRMIEFAWILVAGIIILAIIVMVYIGFRFGPPEGPLATIINFINWVLAPIV